ncbi:hypothetical protein GQ543_01170 [candidate division WOR-3 bacterium]|nr:hypothetical protein [candidate division WOR-3 bacterium]
MVSVKLNTSSSFRAIAKTISTLNLYFNLEFGQPSYGTILVWTKKIGIFSLRPPTQKANDWVLIIDESIAVGHERLLVVYGVRTSQLTFDRALTYSDLTPLFIKASNRWTADLIKNEIEVIIKDFGNVKYIVADGGSAIVKSIRLLSKPHVYDITHKIALLLKKMYGNDPVFIAYSKEMAQMRFKYICSDIAHIVPPKQRSNSRFMNLDILSDWGIKALNCLKDVEKSSKIYQRLQWITAYKDFINELGIVNKVVNDFKILIKTRGLSKYNLKKMKKTTKNNKSINGHRIAALVENIINFLKETLTLLPQEKKILCTSDIIESSFGKYKNYIAQNSTIGITNLSLCLAAFTNPLNPKELMSGMENTTINDLKKWSKEHIGETNLSRRKRFLKLNGV